MREGSEKRDSSNTASTAKPAQQQTTSAFNSFFGFAKNTLQKTLNLGWVFAINDESFIMVQYFSYFLEGKGLFFDLIKFEVFALKYPYYVRNGLEYIQKQST